MAVCPSCRRPTSNLARVCPSCGLELPGRTRLGISYPPSGKLGHTIVGPPPSDDPREPTEVAQATSEAPHARRFEESGNETWFGHVPPKEAEDPPPEEPPRARPDPAGITRSSLTRPAEEVSFRVRGPTPARARPVRARPQRRPWPKLTLWGWSVPYWAAFAGIAAAGLAGACVARFVPAPPSLRVIGFEVTPSGQDLLTVSCGGCADGSTVRLGHARATIVGGVAQLVSSGLAVGENRLPLELEAPGGRVAHIEVTIALAFRVSTDLTGITEVPPYALVVVTAPRGTSVSIGGSPVPSDPGVIRSKVDLAADARGPESRATLVQRKIPVRVLGPELERSTHATISATAVPLVLDTPPTRRGAAWMLRGRTSPHAVLRLLQGGSVVAQVPADANGRFELSVQNARPGPATVAASSPGRVSRQVDCPLPATAPEPPPAP